jgi:MoaA/NifB/PqqE/SkfB family radical SAM enzyme
MCKEKYKDKILVRRSGTFSRDFRKKNSSYYCPSTQKTVAIAPNKKVYPCPFLIKEGYEIGEYKDGKVYLDEAFNNDSTTCMLHEILNRGKKYGKRKVD